MPKKTKKITTIDDLAVMVAEGFHEIHETMATKEDLKGLATKQELRAEIDGVKQEIVGVKKEIDGLKKEVAGLRNAVNNYLELSDKRYLELRQTNAMLVKYIKLIIQKTKISLDTKDLESVL
jgi:uncharacterized coiled-coil DUF342 family protein